MQAFQSSLLQAHSIQSTTSSYFTTKNTWCNLHHYQDAEADECQQYSQGHSRSGIRAPFITWNYHYVLSYKISFHTDPVKLFTLGQGVEREVYCLVLHHIIYFWIPLLKYGFPCSAHFVFLGCRNAASEQPNLPS